MRRWVSRGYGVDGVAWHRPQRSDPWTSCRSTSRSRPHLVANSIEMSVEEVRDDVAYVKFATGCSAPDQQAKDEIMGSSASGFLACARCRRWPGNPHRRSSPSTASG